MIKVAIVDDHPMVLEGIKNLLKAEKQIRFTQSFHSLKDLYAHFNSETEVLLLDINLPDGSGIDACKKLLEKFPSLKIIALTSYEEGTFIKQMLKNGAMGYLLKNTDKSELSTAIQTVHSGQRYLPEHIKEFLLNDSLGQHSPHQFIPKLTSREKEIVELVSQEFTTEEIAEKLFISAKTVESHKSNLFQKLGVKNSAGLVRAAFEKGFI